VSSYEPLNRRDGHPTIAPYLSRALQNRRASNSHPELAVFFLASEGSRTGRVVAPDPYHSRAGDQLGALLLPSCKATVSTVDKGDCNCHANRTIRHVHDSTLFSGGQDT
jgi:hypothetical protein